MIEFTCNCGKKFKVKDEHQGKRAKCPACKVVLHIPQISELSAEGIDADPAVPHVQPQPAPPADPLEALASAAEARRASSRVAQATAVPAASSPATPRKSPEKKNRRSEMVYGSIGLAVVLGLVVWGASSCWSGFSDVMNDPKVAAWGYAKEAVTRSLRSPKSADFGWTQKLDDCVTDLGDGKYLVKGWVDAQNAFGATVRTSFVVTVEHGGGDKWRVLEGPALKSR